MAEKIKIKASQVVDRRRGKTIYIDENGTQVTARSAHIEVEGESATPAASPAAPTSAFPAGPSEAAAPPVQPSVSGEKKVASNGKAKKVRKAKTEASGVRTIGGKAVDLKKYTKVKTKSGGTSYHNGDAVAERLAGKSLDDVYGIAARTLKVEEKELRSKYKHLNVGMQRMALGNRLRKGQGAAA